MFFVKFFHCWTRTWNSTFLLYMGCWCELSCTHTSIMSWLTLKRDNNNRMTAISECVGDCCLTPSGYYMGSSGPSGYYMGSSGPSGYYMGSSGPYSTHLVQNYPYSTHLVQNYPYSTHLVQNYPYSTHLVQNYPYRWVVLDQVGTIWVVLERNVSLLRRLFSFLFHWLDYTKSNTAGVL
jgi:hypothetical protein